MRNRNLLNLLFIGIIVVFQIQPIKSESVEAISDQKYLSMLRVVINFADWDQSSWEGAAPIKETDNFQWFEATIYESGVYENIPNAVHLYKFDNEFDPLNWFHMTSEEWINYRESYVITKIDIPEGLDPNERSRLLSNAFLQIFSTMVADTPSQHYGLRYSGHGSSPGSLFESRIGSADSQWLFENMTSIIDRRIDILDLSHNCGQSNTGMFRNFYMYFDYILATDTQVGGYMMDDYTHYDDTSVDYMYPLIMTPEKSIRDGFEDLIDIRRLRWEYSRNSIIENQAMEALYLFDAHEYESLASMTYQEMIAIGNFFPSSYDLYTYIHSLGNSNIENQFDALRIYYKDNKDFFPWSSNLNGITNYSGDPLAPDFNVFQLLRTPLVVQKGSSISVDLIIRQTNGLTSPVSINHTNEDPTLGVSVTDVFGEEPMHATLTILTSNDTLLGTHVIQVVATSGLITHSVNVQFEVVESIIYLPIIDR